MKSKYTSIVAFKYSADKYSSFHQASKKQLAAIVDNRI